MPNRVQGQIKYLIDNDENVINLSKTNTNWFEVQNIFKAGESVDVSLFDYDSSNPYIQKLNNEDEDFTIWESGYSYSPLLYNPSGSLSYTLDSPILVTIPGTTSSLVTITNGQDNYWDTFSTRIENPGGTGNSIYLQFTASNVDNLTTSSLGVYVRWYATFGSETYPQSAPTAYHTSFIPAGTAEPFRDRIYLGITQGGFGYYDSWTNGSTAATVTVLLEQTFTPGSPTINTYTTGAFETDTNWYLLNENQVKISLSQSFYYGEFISTGSYSGLDSFVFPFSLNNNDLVRFYNVSTSLWNEAGEFIIKDIDTSYSDSTGSFVVLTLNTSPV
jgi:hypothetical protein